MKEKKDWGRAQSIAPLQKHGKSGRGWIVFELLDVALLDLPYEGFALEEVALEIGGELVGDDEKLVVGHFGKRDGAARGN